MLLDLGDLSKKKKNRSRRIVNRLTIFVDLNNLQIEEIIEACNLQIPKKKA